MHEREPSEVYCSNTHQGHRHTDDASRTGAARLLLPGARHSFSSPARNRPLAQGEDEQEEEDHDGERAGGADDDVVETIAAVSACWSVIRGDRICG